MRSIHFILAFGFLLLSACQKSRDRAFVGSLPGSSADQAIQDIITVLNEDGWNMQYQTSSGVALDDYHKINDGVADFAFAYDILSTDENTDEIRTIIPLSAQSLVIACRDSIQFSSLQELFAGRKVVFIEIPWIQSVLTAFGVDSLSYQKDVLYSQDAEKMFDFINSGSHDIFVGFGNVSAKKLDLIFRRGWKLVSLGDVNLSGKGSAVDGFCIRHPKFYPFIIPKKTFGNRPVDPILTIAYDALLVTNHSVPEELIYDFLVDLFSNRHQLADRSLFFSSLDEQFDHSALAFPLHVGTQDFLRRNEPSIYERYAELMGVTFSIIVVFFGFVARSRMVKKNRIDVYYLGAIDAKSIEELDKLKREAIHLVERERIQADASFSIFLQLVEMRKRELKENISVPG